MTPAAFTQNSTKIEKRHDVISPSLMNAAHISNLDTSNDESHLQVEDGEKVQTEAQPLLNLDHFQPELHSGFKPIYPVDGAEKHETIVQKSSVPKKDDSIEALIYEDSETESAEENETEINEMTTNS